MIDKAKKHRTVFTVIAAASLVLAVACTVAVLMLVRAQSYVPMWILLGVSVLGYYASVFLAFGAIDRNTARKFIAVYNDVGDDESAIAERLGWKEKAVTAFMKKCVKWGYLERSAEE